MKAKNKLLTLLILGATTAAATSMINKYIKVNATSKHFLSDSRPLCYRWRLGNIFYTKTGSGKPLLLIHDLNSSSSSYEWNQMIDRLKDNYTVYALDLLGCGRSEKPNMTYTNYLYVQLISDFIKSEIGHRTNVIATGESASIVTMACNNSPEMFDQLMFISPDSFSTCNKVPSKRYKYYKLLLDLPIIGTLLYNFASSQNSIMEEFITKNMYNPYSFKSEYLNTYYESAHLGESPKSIYASLRCNYTKCNITNALKHIDNSIYIVGGQESDHIENTMEEYKSTNPSIEYSLIPKSRRLPQLEAPDKLLDLINMFFI